MGTEPLVFSIFVIFTGAAILATLALLTRQSLLVAYILLGVLLGPWGAKLVVNSNLINQIGEVGIVFLLFLLGLELNPHDLWNMLKKASWVTCLSSLLFALVGYGVSRYFGFGNVDALVVAVAMMFSSTIIGLKLLPTTVLHHQHTGEVIVSVLLLQDLIAITVLMGLHGASHDGLHLHEVMVILLGLPALLAIAFVFEHYILIRLLRKFDRFREYIFLLALGWCLGMSQLSEAIGLSAEIGAFIAGVAIAAGPIARYIAENLKPLRDFFLVLFFFSIGASLELPSLTEVVLPAAILAALLLIIKPQVFKFMLGFIGEAPDVAREAGVRLGQASEFSLIVAAFAFSASPSIISSKAHSLIQLATVFTFVVSSYWIVLRFPTPLAFSEKLRRD